MPPRGRPHRDQVPMEPQRERETVEPQREQPQVVEEPEVIAHMPRVEEPLRKIEKRFREQQPPVFNGLGQPSEAEQWIRTLERIFEYMECHDKARVSCTLFQLKEEADYWWESVRRTMSLEERNNLTWEEFKLRFNEKYVPQSYRNRKEWEFLSLRQEVKSVTDYDRAFNQLSRYAPHLVDTDGTKADRFRRGLVPEIGMSLAGHGGLSYAQSLSRALDIESMMPRDSKVPATTTGKFSDHKRKRNDRQQSPTKNQGKNNFQENAPPYQENRQDKPNFQQDRPFCQRCKRNHEGICRAGTKGCYSCGQEGHIARYCPQKNQPANDQPN